VTTAFDDAMVSIYTRAKDEIGYVAGYFIQMVSELGGLEAARQLIRAPAPSEGFTTLWEKKRLDLSVEYHVLLPQFEHLFDRREREIAYRRLKDYGFDVGVLDRMEDPV
jgi:hypothetical protein